MEELVAKGIGAFPPVLQFALLVGVGVGSAIFWWRARGGNGRFEMEDFGGRSTYNILQGIYRVLQEMRTDNARFANESNQKADERYEMLRDMKERQLHRR